MIRSTCAGRPGGVLSAYSDNAAVIEGAPGRWLEAEPGTGATACARGPMDIVLKAETHNHPTAVSPFPGAATGVGGEIRDEAATGRGARSKAGLTGFSVSNLKIPGFVQPWEHDFGKPERIASALRVMTEAPLGAARFNNEFGRPALAGYFRTPRGRRRRRQGPRPPRLPQADNARGRDGATSAATTSRRRRCPPAPTSSCSAARRW